MQKKQDNNSLRGFQDVIDFERGFYVYLFPKKREETDHDKQENP